MRTRTTWLVAVVVVVLAGVVGRAQMTPWLQWTLLPKAVMSEIVGEASGENAYHMIMETGGYDKDRTATEFSSVFHETQFYVDKAKEYGLAGVEIARFPDAGKYWDAVKGELWEVAPIRQKIASYIDSTAMLAQGSTTGEATGELIWVGAGRAEDLQGKDLAGKIAVTDGSLTNCIQKGAAGVVGIMNSSRPLFDPLQMAWANVPSNQAKGPVLGFQVPPREGEYLKKRLLAGQKITVKAQVVAETRTTDYQDVTWFIPGTDPNAGEVIFSAHLFEGYVKQGGNDDISGCATVMEIARTLNTLIREKRIPPPRRTIRFLIGPEYAGTGPWVKANKALMEKTLCNINLDMVGLWLSKSQSFMCLMRTTFGNAHYVNDVMENYYRFVGEGNRERIQLRSNFYPVPQRIVAPTGADEPFYYSIETHYGASDHEVFNDWGVQVPGVMMIDWPDRWYHTSGDHVDKTDPTQLKRVAIIGAAGAYTIASADDEAAIRIASEIAGNGAGRLAHQLARAIARIDEATAETLPAAWKTARGYLEAAAINEKDTLETVNQLAADKKRVGEHVAAMQKGVDQLAATELSTLDAHVRAAAARLAVVLAPIRPTELETQAAALVPRTTAKVKANGYLGYRDAINAVPMDQRAKLPTGRVDTAELARLVNGRHSVLDIRKLLDGQAETEAELQQVLNYIDVLALAGLVEKPVPAPAKKRK
jgi:aminopeptidase YwaD